MVRNILHIILICLFIFPTVGFTADSTSFNPVPIPVVAKGAGGVPVGTIIAWPVAQNPADMENWLECNGQSISASVYPELVALVGGKAPDLRGLFLRGVGGNAAPLGVGQGDAIRDIRASLDGVASAYEDSWPARSGAINYSSGGRFYHSNGHVPTGATLHVTFAASEVVPTAEENRPVNKAVRYLVRALP